MHIISVLMTQIMMITIMPFLLSAVGLRGFKKNNRTSKRKMFFMRGKNELAGKQV